MFKTDKVVYLSRTDVSGVEEKKN